MKRLSIFNVAQLMMVLLLMSPGPAWSQSAAPAPATVPGSGSPADSASDATSAYAPLELPLGVRMDVAKSWKILGEDVNKQIVDSAADILKRGGLELPKDKVNLFRANSPALPHASLFVNTQPAEGAEEEARGLTDADLNDLLDVYKAGMEKVRLTSNITVLEYYPIKKLAMGKHIALIISYKRAGINGGPPVYVRINRLLIGNREISITLSYPEGYKELEAAVKHMVSSIRIE
ncbi:MAG: hypothetical protein ACAI35_27675 [Candidatus Methylacidiphilales bacterium]